MKRIVCNEDVCIGCHLCEIACVTEHSRSKDVIKAYKEESPRPNSRNLVEEKEAISFSVNCQHCEDPACVEACIAGAMVKNYETGVVRPDQLLKDLIGVFHPDLTGSGYEPVYLQKIR